MTNYKLNVLFLRLWLNNTKYVDSIILSFDVCHDKRERCHDKHNLDILTSDIKN
jgi:hypothetical protein